MSQLEQHINFYQQQFRKAEIRFPLKQVLIFWSLVLVVLLLVASLDYARLENLRNRNQKMQVSQEQLEKATTQLNEQLSARVIDPVLQKQELQLRQTLQAKRDFFAVLQTQGDSHQLRYSEVMEGLARRSSNSLWLTRIRMQSPGPSLALSGLTTHARAVPDYLAGLKQEDVFQGMEFRTLAVERQRD